jgi:hypothetical protein
MRPKTIPTPARGEADMFRNRLDNLIDMRHELARLAGLIDWKRFDEAFGGLYAERGSPRAADAVDGRTASSQTCASLLRRCKSVRSMPAWIQRLDSLARGARKAGAASPIGAPKKMGVCN